jgi:hypothetical protein
MNLLASVALRAIVVLVVGAAAGTLFATPDTSI